MKKIVLGIVAHVDSGKTTLSESLLYRAGIIKHLGRVDHKTAYMDVNEIERDRGITIFSNQADIVYGDCEITLLDTPGHVDFTAETERVLKVLDYAVIVISGTDVVQSHTKTLWKLLENYNIPIFIFINKMDISQISREDIIKELKKELGNNCIDFSDCSSDEFYENVAMSDDELMNKYLNGEKIEIHEIADLIKMRKIYPCFFGAALKNEGISELLDGLKDFSKPTGYSDKFGARVFKITVDEQGERLTHLKVTGGELKVKDKLIHKFDKEESAEKVNQIRVYSGAKYTCENIIKAGGICTVTGLSKSFAGEGFGEDTGILKTYIEPVLAYRVRLLEDIDINVALSKFKLLEQEDPQLKVSWDERLKEITFKIMGEIQLEILKRIIEERFGINVLFEHGKISYKESIKAPIEGVGHYEPLRHYAEVHLLLEPGTAGSGVQIETDCSRDELSLNWQRLILTHLAEKTHIGVLTGSPITDIKITLIAGKAHQKHTDGGDFRQATYRAVRHGLRNAESVLLEPWYEFTLEVPTENIGRAMTDLQKMSADFSQPELSGEMSLLSGSVPVYEIREYHNEVISYTKGRGKLSCSFKGYYECHNSEEVIEKTAYNADADVENSADSVFCSHGAGFNVNWKDVLKYQHIQTGLDFNKPDKEEIAQRVNHYLTEIADDKELMRIFERTYGTVKRPEHTAFKLKRERITTGIRASKSSVVTDGREYLLVDGYNIIFAWDELREIAKVSLEAAREKLTDILCNYRGFKQCELILVFDAYKVKKNPGEIEKIHNISVVYTKEAETADTYIEKVSHELSKKHRVTVATSDSLEQLIIFGNGAMRVSARAFKAEVESVQREISEFLKGL